VQLPDFVQQLPSGLSTDDVDYLSVKGAFTTPGVSLQNALLRAFVEFVYPYMPIVDLHSVLHSVYQHGGRNSKVSLLLYQAIMFSAVPFVEAHVLLDGGFPSREMATRVFFQRTRVRKLAYYALQCVPS
jgi:hypothetical protein